MWLHSGGDFLNWMQISLPWRSALCRQQHSSFRQLQVPTHVDTLSMTYRTSLEDIEALPGIVIRIGKEVDSAIRPAELKSE